MLFDFFAIPLLKKRCIIYIVGTDRVKRRPTKKYLPSEKFML